MPSSPFGFQFIVNNAYNGRTQKHESDNKIPVNSFRTTSLFHYTKKITLLKKILESGLIPNFCSEEFLEDVTVGIPMVSFCDIPLSRTHYHTSQYGYYAIALTTEYGEEHGINPVFYIASSELMERILRWPYREFQAKRFFYNPTAPFYKKMYGNFNGKEIKNYAENEWRYVVPQTRKFKWMQSFEEYIAWRSSGEDGHKPDPTQNPILYSSRLRFEAKDVNYIIVRRESEVRSMIELIDRMRSIGGSDEPLTPEDRKYLATRIISFESTRRDY